MQKVNRDNILKLIDTLKKSIPKLLNSEVDTANMSVANTIALLPSDSKKKLLGSLSSSDLNLLMNDWHFWARPSQLLPQGNWHTWFISAGRGFGKALALSTVVKTPVGDTTIGDVQVGDTIYDGNMQPTKVTDVSYITYNGVIYSILTWSGETIEAEAEHEWFIAEGGKAWRTKYPTGISILDSARVVTTEKLFSIVKRNNLNSMKEYFLLSPIKGSAEERFDKDLVLKYMRYYDVNALYPNNRPDLEKIEFTNAELRFMLQMYCGHFGELPNAMHTKNQLKVIKKTIAIHGGKDTMSLGDTIVVAPFMAYYVKKALLIYELPFVKSPANALYLQHRATWGGPRFSIKKIIVAVDINYTTLTATKSYHIVDVDDVVQFNVSKAMLRAISKIPPKFKAIRIVDIAPSATIPVKCLSVASKTKSYLITDSYIVTHNTRTGAEAVREWVKNGVKRIALIGQTVRDVRDTMLLGESGLISVCRKDDDVPSYIASRRVVIWPKSNAACYLYSGDEPDQLRGPQHEKVWADELAKFKYPADTLDMAEFGLRIGDNPQIIITTTMKPLPLFKDILKNPATVVTRGSTYDNAINLNASFIKNIKAKYEGTRLGRQEVYSDYLGDVIGALWTQLSIDENRLTLIPKLDKIIVAVDPAVTSSVASDEVGIIVAGLFTKGNDKHVVIIEDKTAILPAKDWTKLVVDTYNEYNADYVVAEVNNGGELVELAIKNVDRTVRYKSVWAKKGKYVRAEPVALLSERGFIHILNVKKKLETELVEWVPSDAKSPNRLDAFVWACTDLLLTTQEVGTLIPLPAEFKRLLG